VGRPAPDRRRRHEQTRRSATRSRSAPTRSTSCRRAVRASWPRRRAAPWGC
jgi:hypothetical protein